jgi:hypothetical protein
MTLNASNARIWYRYTFTLDDGTTRTFEVNLDPDTLNVIPAENQTIPGWARLDFIGCDHCPLPPGTTHCPIAVNLGPIVEAFRDVPSSRTAEITVETAERKYQKEGSVQDALFPLLGIYMSASGCPSMEMLKPMVRHHLPFASLDETTYRVFAMYVSAQYLRMQNGLAPDWELKGLSEIYDRVNEVNQSFCHRLAKAVNEDALINAVVILDALGTLVKMPDPQGGEKLRKMFAMYLSDASSPK